jgi:hypothetical protein
MLSLDEINTDLFRQCMYLVFPLHIQAGPPPYVPVTSDYQVKHDFGLKEYILVSYREICESFGVIT